MKVSGELTYKRSVAQGYRVTVTFNDPSNTEVGSGDSVVNALAPQNDGSFTIIDSTTTAPDSVTCRIDKVEYTDQ